MTQKEWLKCSNPEDMLLGLAELEPSNRKVRLFMCACCRRIWQLVTDKRCRNAVEVAERFADGHASEEDMEEAANAAEEAAEEAEDFDLSDSEKFALVGSANAASFALSNNEGIPMTREANSVAKWAVYALTGCKPADDEDEEQEKPENFDEEVRGQIGLLRDIFGNPFHLVALDPSWLTEKVLALGQAIYDENSFRRLPDLADALEEAGCDDADVLSHCRGRGPHVRGCWVVDLVLGKD